jgi:hypothetical protein
MKYAITENENGSYSLTRYGETRLTPNNCELEFWFEIERLQKENEELQSLKWYSMVRRIAEIAGVDNLRALPDHIEQLVELQRMFSNFCEMQSMKVKP